MKVGKATAKLFRQIWAKRSGRAYVEPEEEDMEVHCDDVYQEMSFKQLHKEHRAARALRQRIQMGIEDNSYP